MEAVDVMVLELFGCMNVVAFRIAENSSFHYGSAELEKPNIAVYGMVGVLYLTELHYVL